MGRKRNEDKGVGELQLKERGGKAYVRWQGRFLYFGDWDRRLGRASEDAVRAYVKWQDGVVKGGVGGGKYGMTVAHLWALWLESGDPPLGRADEIKTVSKRFVASFGQMPMLSFGLPQLTMWQGKLCREQKEVVRGDEVETFPALGRWMVRRHVWYVCRCWRWAVGQGHISIDRHAELALIESPKRGVVKESKNRLPVSEEDAWAAIPLMPTNARRLCSVMWWCGARPGELLGLKWRDIQKTGVLTTPRGTRVDLDAWGVWGAVIEKHKTIRLGQDRVLFFGPKAQEIMGNWKAREASFVFPTREGNAYDGKNFRRACRAGQAKAKVSWVPYQLRNSCATRIQENGWGFLAVAAVLGHRLRGATIGYAGVDFRLAAEVMGKMG